MSARRPSRPRRARGRPYRVRVRGERRVQIDYPKLSRALLEQAAYEAHEAQRTRQDVPEQAEELGDADTDGRTQTELTDESEEVGNEQDA